MLRRIRIRNYKSLQDVEVHLQPLTVLFGSNAAGKSNFLDALQLLSRLATSRNLNEAFNPPYRGTPLESFAFGTDGIEGLLKRETVSFSFEADVELSSSVVTSAEKQIREMRLSTIKEDEKEILVREKYLRYGIEIEISPRSGLLRVADEYLIALNSKGGPSRRHGPFLDRVEDRILIHPDGRNGYPAYIERYLDHSLLSRPVYAPHYPHLVAMRQELASWYFFYFEPRERMRLPNPVKEVRHIGLMGEELAAFLNTLKVLEPQQFKAVERALHTVIPSINGIEVGVNHIGQVELNLREGATAIPASLVSEGTLRLLGLLALGGVKEPASLIGFEEPENGIHPRRIQLIAEYLKSSTQGGQSQIVVTTHSPLLPDLMPEQSLYACRKVDGKTQIGPFRSGPLFKQGDAQDTLDAESTPMSVRIVRGDFDA